MPPGTLKLPLLRFRRRRSWVQWLHRGSGSTQHPGISPWDLRWVLTWVVQLEFNYWDTWWRSEFLMPEWFAPKGACVFRPLRSLNVVAVECRPHLFCLLETMVDSDGCHYHALFASEEKAKLNNFEVQSMSRCSIWNRYYISISELLYYLGSI